MRYQGFLLLVSVVFLTSTQGRAPFAYHSSRRRESNNDVIEVFRHKEEFPGLTISTDEAVSKVEIGVHSPEKEAEKTRHRMMLPKLNLGRSDHRHHKKHLHHHHGVNTRIGAMAKAFSGVLNGAGEINIPHLLHACHKFEREMRNIGQKQSAKDLRNNVAKTEACYKVAPHDKRKNMYSLLRFEKQQDIHGYGPHGLSLLKENSAAMGLLWIRRSLSFQCRMFRHLLDDNTDARKAALNAYGEELQSYHGWALQKVYVMAVKSAMPSKRDFLARLGGFTIQEFGEQEEKATRKDLEELMSIWQPLLQRWEEVYQELDLEDQRRV